MLAVISSTSAGRVLRMIGLLRSGPVEDTRWRRYLVGGGTRKHVIAVEIMNGGARDDR